LLDLPGIGRKSLMRLNDFGIYTVQDFYHAPSHRLKHIFRSVAGNYWYLKLRGFEIENYKHARKSFGQQYALPQPVSAPARVLPILTKLVEKMGFRLRNSGYKTQGIHLSFRYKDGTGWHMGRKTSKTIYDSRDIYQEILKLYRRAPPKKISVIGVSCFELVKDNKLQLELFSDTNKKEDLTKTLDKINKRWGKFVISPAGMLSAQGHVHDRIGFGNV
jgi:DNA polymerase-4